MSIDQSLKIAGSLVRHRNVLTRAERMQRLAKTGRIDPEKDSPLGLPKVVNRKVEAGKKKKAAEDEDK